MLPLSPPAGVPVRAQARDQVAGHALHRRDNLRGAPRWEVLTIAFGVLEDVGRFLGNM